jgi:hypothetical protein
MTGQPQRSGLPAAKGAELKRIGIEGWQETATGLDELE